MQRFIGSITRGVEDGGRLIRVNDQGELSVVPSEAGTPFRYFLTSTGDGTGESNLIGDYSAAPVDFYYQADALYDIYDLLIAISDNANFNQTDYGAIVSGLTNGVSFFISPSPGVYIRLISSRPVKQNYQWLSDIADTRLTTFAGTAQTLSVNLNIAGTFGKPLRLPSGYKFIVRLNDNFTGLVGHTFGIRGIRQVTPPIS